MQTRKNDGFTLVELIVVIAILAILAGIAVPAYSGYIEKANVAADEQLLHAVNIAFLSAAAEHADGTVSNASLSYGGSTGAVTVTGVASVTSSGAPDLDALKTAFATYYGDNNAAAFKTVARLKFNSTTHMFEILSTVTQQSAVDAFNKSNWAGKTEELADTVNNLAGMLANRIATDGIKELYDDFMTEEEYNGFMSKYNLTEESSDTELANATVMYVADKLSGHTAESIGAIMQAGGTQQLITEIGAIPAAAMMYGLMNGYANSEYNTGYTLNTNPSGVNEVMGEFAELSESSGFQNYFNNSDANKKGGFDDLNAFLGAMTVVNGYEGEFDLTDEDLFVSDETTALLESILGANSQ